MSASVKGCRTSAVTRWLRRARTAGVGQASGEETAGRDGQGGAASYGDLTAWPLASKRGVAVVGFDEMPRNWRGICQVAQNVRSYCWPRGKHRRPDQSQTSSGVTLSCGPSSGDRLDGKPTQAITGDPEQPNRLVVEIIDPTKREQ